MSYEYNNDPYRPQGNPNDQGYPNSPYPQPDFSQDSYPQAPYDQAPYDQAPYDQAPYSQDPYYNPTYQQAPYPHQPPYQQYPDPYSYPPQPPQNGGVSALAVVSLVLGIMALIISLFPILNIGSLIFGVAGIILAIIGLRGIKQGKNSGKGIAIAGIVVSSIAVVVAAAILIFSMILINEAASNGGSVRYSTTTTQNHNESTSSTTRRNENSGAEPTNSNEQGNSQSPQSGTNNQQQPQQLSTDNLNLAIGQTYISAEGLSVTVNSVDRGYKALGSPDNKSAICVNVTIVNNNNSSVSFSKLDWESQDPNGLRQPADYLVENAQNEFQTGSLAPGGQVTGNIYFDEPVVKILYTTLKSPNGEPEAGWNV